ncbi:hypothetical protein ABUW04_08335 [Streptacidiphilus sp. N1-10]|uniref:Adhesin n=1 Tax=Streptacidiphilus jeojiensis TaxID=3229225 RepID=A0ABV6XJT4_9ACTN
MFIAESNALPGWRGGDGNAAYLDKTLRFQPIEMHLNESVSSKFLKLLLLRSFLVSFLLYLAGFLFGVVLLLIGGSAVGFGWLVFCGLVSTVVFWVVLLFSRLPEDIAEWRVLLAERYGRRDQAYLGIRQVLSTRGFPVGVEEKDGRLILRESSYVVYISVFTYGSSLYLGWMMWRSRRGYQLIGQYIRDMVQGLQGRNTIELQILRSERVRALREAAHIACREGLAVALSDSDGGWPDPQVEPQPSYGGGIPGPTPAPYEAYGPYGSVGAPPIPVTPPTPPYGAQDGQGGLR